MALKMASNLQVSATLVANEFIDRHMAGANGEYVKVYLYLLRHIGEDITVVSIADALNHTETDVARALKYWEQHGVLASVDQKIPKKEAVPDMQQEEAAPDRKRETVQLPPRAQYSPYQISQLKKKEEFSQLLYIAQKYLNAAFVPRDCEVLAYLYEGLGMSAELLEYLIESCVQSNHTSMRYIETVALGWHQDKISTVEQARLSSEIFIKGYTGVMKAFGITDRKPGTQEHNMMRRWFLEDGFTEGVVLEACNRTMSSLHKPSFEYADSILSAWKQAGVKSVTDIRVLDKRREGERKQKEEGRKGQTAPPKASKNQFHNFEQRNTNYDAMVLERLKKQLQEQ